MGYLENLYVKESVSETLKKKNADVEKFNEEGKAVCDELVKSILGFRSDDAKSLYMTKIDPDMKLRARTPYVLIALLLEEHLTFDEIFDPKAETEVKKAVGDAIIKAASGTEQEKEDFLNRVKAATVKQFDAMYDFVEDKLNDWEQGKPGAEQEFYNKAGFFADGFYDFMDQEVIKSDMWDGEKGKVNYELYKETEVDSLQEVQDAISLIEVKAQRIKLHMEQLMTEHLLSGYTEEPTPTDFQLSMNQATFMDDSMLIPAFMKLELEENKEKNNNILLVAKNTNAITSAVMRVLKKHLKSEELQVFMTEPTLQNRLELRFTQDPATLQPEEIYDFSKYCYVVLRDRYGKEQQISADDALNPQKARESLAELSKEIKEISATRIELGKQKVQTRMAECRGAVPETMQAYKNIYTDLPDACTEITYRIEDFEKLQAQSVMNGEDPYSYILIGNHTAAELVNPVLAEKQQNQNPDAQVRRAILTGIMLAALKQNIPVTGIYGKEPEELGLEASTFEFKLPESANNLKPQAGQNIGQIYRDVRPALTLRNKTDDMKAVHKKLLDKKSGSIVKKMDQACFADHGFLGKSNVLDRKYAVKMLDLMKKSRKAVSEIGKTGETAPENYILGNGLRLSRETAIMALAFSDVNSVPDSNRGMLAPGQNISADALEQNVDISEKLNQAARELDRMIALSKKDPEKADSLMRTAIAQAIPRLTVTEQNPDLTDPEALKAHAYEHAMNLRTKVALLAFARKDDGNVTLNDISQPVKAHLKDVQVTTNQELSEFIYLRTTEYVNNLFEGKNSVAANLDEIEENNGRMIYLNGRNNGLPNPLTFSSMDSESKKATAFSQEYVKQHFDQIKELSSLGPGRVLDVENTLAETLRNPAETINETMQVQTYGAGSRSVEKLRDMNNQVRFFDHDGQLVGDDHIFRAGEILARWTPEDGFIGFRLNAKGRLEKVPLDFSDKVHNKDNNEINDLMSRTKNFIKAETRFERLMGEVAHPFEKMPNSEGLEGSTVSCSDAFKEATGEHQKDVMAALIMGAALQPDRISKLETSSSGMGGNYAAKQAYYMTDWLMKYDGRSKHFGESHLNARAEVNELLKNYDPLNPQHRAHYEKLLKTAVKNAVQEGIPNGNFNSSQECMKMYVAATISKALKNEDEKFLNQLEPDDVRALRMTEEFYRLQQLGDRAQAKLHARDYRSEEEKENLIMQEAAVKLIVANIRAKREGIQKETDRVIYSGDTDRYKGDHLSVLAGFSFTSVMTGFHTAVDKKAPNSFEMALAEDNGAEKLIDLVGKSFMKTKEGQNLMLLPDICLAQKITELTGPSNATAQSVAATIAKDLPPAADPAKVMESLKTEYLKQRDDLFDGMMKDKPILRTRLDDLLKTPLKDRQEMDVSILISQPEKSVQAYDMLNASREIERQITKLYSLGDDRYQKMSEKLQALQAPLINAAQWDPSIMYVHTKKFTELCQEMLNEVDEKKNPDVVAAMERILEVSSAMKAVAAQETEFQMTNVHTVDENRISPDMMNYYMDACGALETYKNEFEEQDPFYLPSNQWIRSFKRQLDHALSVAREYDGKCSVGLEDREKLKNALEQVAESAQNVSDHVKPSNRFGRSRCEKIAEIGDCARKMSSDYTKYFAKENERFADRIKENAKIIQDLATGREETQKLTEAERPYSEAYAGFLDTKNKLPVNMETPKAIRQLFEQLPFYKGIIESMPDLNPTKDYKGNPESLIQTAVAKMVVANSILAEKKQFDKDTLAQTYAKEPARIMEKVLESEHVKALVKAIAENNKPGHILQDHGTEILSQAIAAAKPEQKVLKAEPEQEKEKEILEPVRARRFTI